MLSTLVACDRSPREKPAPVPNPGFVGSAARRWSGAHDHISRERPVTRAGDGDGVPAGIHVCSSVERSPGT